MIFTKIMDLTAHGSQVFIEFKSVVTLLNTQLFHKQVPLSKFRRENKTLHYSRHVYPRSQACYPEA